MQSFRRDIWAVGVIDRPIETFLSEPLGTVSWLPEAGGDRYFADPFPFPGTSDTLLVEEYSYLEERGRLTAIQFPEGTRLPRHASGLEVPWHIAYPFTFAHDGEYYCVPDTGNGREVALYRWDCESHRWERVKTLLGSVDLVDSTLFRDDSRWWMLCGEVRSTAALFAWYADDLLGVWRPHPDNPVKRDPQSSRPAGTAFFHGGSWCRPAQDCSRTYGGAVALNRITALSPTRFSETTVNILRPDPEGAYPEGLHTLSAWGARTIVDGKRLGWRSPRHLLSSLIRRGRSLYGR